MYSEISLGSRGVENARPSILKTDLKRVGYLPRAACRDFGGDLSGHGIGGNGGM